MTLLCVESDVAGLVSTDRRFDATQLVAVVEVCRVDSMKKPLDGLLLAMRGEGVDRKLLVSTRGTIAGAAFEREASNVIPLRRDDQESSEPDAEGVIIGVLDYVILLMGPNDRVRLVEQQP